MISVDITIVCVYKIVFHLLVNEWIDIVIISGHLPGLCWQDSVAKWSNVKQMWQYVNKLNVPFQQLYIPNSSILECQKRELLTTCGRFPALHCPVYNCMRDKRCPIITLAGEVGGTSYEHYEEHLP